MNKKIIVIIITIVALLSGVLIGRLTAPTNEIVAEDNSIEENNSTLNDSDIENSELVVAKKYLLKFIEAQDEADNLPWNEEEYMTTIGMNNLASQEYEIWDDLLNEIYSELKEILSEEDMDNLREEQVKWIEERDARAEDAGKVADGGSMQPMLIISSKGETTKERCLELIKLYMK